MMNDVVTPAGDEKFFRLATALSISLISTAVVLALVDTPGLLARAANEPSAFPVVTESPVKLSKALVTFAYIRKKVSYTKR